MKYLRKSAAGCSSAVEHAPRHGSLFPSAHMAIRFLNSKGRERGGGTQSGGGELEHSFTVTSWGTWDLGNGSSVRVDRLLRGEPYVKV